MAVIHDERPTRVIEIGLGERDDAAGRRAYDRSRGRGNIDPEVRLPRLSVQDPLAAVDAGYDTERRPDEAGTVARRRAPVETRRPDLLVLLPDAGQDFLGRCDHALRQAVDPLDVVGPLGDVERGPGLRAIRIEHREQNLLRLVPAESDDEAAVVVYRDRLSSQRHLGARLDLAEDEPAFDGLARELEARRLGSRRKAGPEKRDQEGSGADRMP